MINRRGSSRRFLSGALVALLVMLNVQSGSAQEGEKAPTEKTISIENEVLTVYGKQVTLPCKRADLVKVLGEPSRDKRAGKDDKPYYNRVLTWDDQGVVALMRRDEDSVHSVSIALGKETHDFWPQQTFAGKLMVDGAEIKNDSDIGKINSAKKGKPFEQDQAFKHWWTIKHTDIVHYLDQRPERGIIYVSVNVRSK